MHLEQVILRKLMTKMVFILFTFQVDVFFLAKSEDAIPNPVSY
jgi:hypothetical protein